jgi:BASS family bile acid:Na+ symporter
MQVVELVHIALPVSLMLIVLALGLRCTWTDTMFLFHEPALLVRSLLSMSVVVPIAAVLMATTFDLKPPVKVALVVLAVSPVPPILPPKLIKLVTRDDYVYGLLVATSLLAILLIPLSLTIISSLTRHEVHVDAALVARSVATSVLLPLGAGLLLRHFFPGFANRISGPVSIIGNLLLLFALLAILGFGWRGFAALVGDGTLLAFVALTLLALGVGHWLGGPRGDDRTVLALSNASRHPGVAIALGASLYPDQKKLIAVAVLLYLIVATISTIPYTQWRRKLHERIVEGQASGAPSKR